jgi:predicted transcriptional regulator
MTDADPIPDAALEDVAYLSRSPNRVRILEALTREAYARRELGEVTETSRTTLGRILSEFEERGWAERTADGTYASTARGDHVAAAFRPLVASMDVIRTLGDAIGCLPTDELSIGIHHFADATVRSPNPNVPLGPARRLANLLAEAERFRTLTFISPPTAIGDAMQAGVDAGRLSAEHVLAGGLVEHLREQPEGPPAWTSYLEAGARVYEYRGHVPCNLFVVDGHVLLMRARPQAGHLVESQNENVRTWADELIDDYREEAERMDPEAFAP